MERANAWKGYDVRQVQQLEALCDEYRSFLDGGKTERECAALTISTAKAAGYRDLKQVVRNGETLKTGDKVYAACMGKAVILFHIGQRDMEEGMNILGAHIDSPRLDVKQNPLYEDSGFAYLDTHYYGGVKKYQWVAMPLSIHGVVVKKDGQTIDVVIGEADSDPVVGITDLLPHLAAKQLEKKASAFIEGEKLDVLIGSRPLKDEEKNGVKANILEHLEEKYGIGEEDFLSAELEVVPAGKARDAGLDRSLIMAYGQDDRVCAFTSLKAMLDVTAVEKTACCILVDKEEIGSTGATGMNSKFFENAAAELLDRMGQYSDLRLRRMLANSNMLSSDVTAAYDPLFAEAYEGKNTAFAGNGMAFSKFTGSKGKTGSNDANAEYIARIRRILDDQKICYQFAELGRVDMGGGGTIAYILAHYGMNVIDCGVAVLNMHAPWEVTSKADIYEAKKGYEVFLKKM